MLAKSLLEGYSFGSVQGSKYSAAEGPNLIAMETAMELRDIYESTFYKIDELELTAYAASMESADQSVQEGIGSSIKSAMTSLYKKVKEMIIKLKNKILGWLSNARRLMDGIFMSGAEFATKYEKQLKALNLSGYEIVDAPDYDHKKIDDGETAEAIKFDTIADKEAVQFAKNIMESASSSGSTAAFHNEEIDNQQKQQAETLEKNWEKSIGQCLPAGIEYDSINVAALRKAYFIGLLGGDPNGDNIGTTTYTVDISYVIKTLKGGNKILSKLKANESKTKSSFDKVITALEKAEKTSTDQGNTGAAALIKAHTRIFTASRNIGMAMTGAMIDATKHRIAFFKKVATGAFSYSRKKDKADKQK